MPKSLLVLMLMVTQLLMGSGVSLYLCIRGDGSYHIDAGAESCDSCQISPETDGSCGTSRAEQKCGSACDKHKQNNGRENIVEVEGPNAPCDCTHVPLLVASEQLAQPARNVLPGDFEQMVSLAALPPTLGAVCPIAQHQKACFLNNLALTDFSLAAISTVVIRC